MREGLAGQTEGHRWSRSTQENFLFEPGPADNRGEVVKQKLEETVTWLEPEPGTRWLAPEATFFQAFLLVNP